MMKKDDRPIDKNYWNCSLKQIKEKFKDTPPFAGFPAARLTS